MVVMEDKVREVSRAITQDGPNMLEEEIFFLGSH